jgi:hypothetical protein
MCSGGITKPAAEERIVKVIHLEWELGGGVHRDPVVPAESLELVGPHVSGVLGHL